ncbi:MAG: LysM peptidoglycan-binding domain-containing protein [Clostridia bacterium]|nr:LysM peptidoglycan-binding domain-containing protein [Clostridia bacterium]
MMLTLSRLKFYRVKRGQTIAQIARVFCIPPSVLVYENGLKEEVREGDVLTIPPQEGNCYLVRGGESKSLLCGNEEQFARKNKTSCFYPFQTIYLEVE